MLRAGDRVLTRDGFFAHIVSLSPPEIAEDSCGSLTLVLNVTGIEQRRAVPASSVTPIAIRSHHVTDPRVGAGAMRLQIRTLEQELRELRELRQKEQARLQECGTLQEELASAQSETAALKAQVALLQMQGCGASMPPIKQPEAVRSATPSKSDHPYDAIGRVVMEDGLVRMQEERASSTTLANGVLADNSVPSSVDALLNMDDKVLEASGLTAQVT